MDKIINYLLLTIIFVFDPLAISLVVAANFAFEQLKPKKESPSTPNPELNNLSSTPIEEESIEEEPIEEEPIEEEISYEVYGDSKISSLQNKIDKLKFIQTSTTLSSKRWNRIQEEIEKAQQKLNSLSKSDSSDQINYF